MFAGIAVLVLPLFGQAALAQGIDAEKAGIIDWLTQLGVLIGSALAFYGRIRATRSLRT